MFSGGDYEEVGRWLRNFVAAHAKRADPRLEAVVETDGPRGGLSYGVRVRRGASWAPGRGEPPLELDYAEVARERGRLAWCDTVAGRVRALAARLAESGAAPLSA